MIKFIFILASTFKFALWGMGSGIVLGMIYVFCLFTPALIDNVISGETAVAEVPASVFFIFIISIVGMVLGFIIGLPIGIVDGLVFSGITLIFFNPPHDIQRYRMETGFVIGVLTFAMSVLGFDYILRQFFSEPPDGSTLLAALLATGSAVRASQRVAMEYIEELNLTSDTI